MSFDKEKPRVNLSEAKEEPERVKFSHGILLDSMSIASLIELRDQVTAKLPPLKLSEMNLEEEVMLQYLTIRELQTETINDDDVPVNQRAQVANSVTASLNKLTELQERLRPTERHKAIENTLIRCLSKLPEETASEFLDEYEKVLRDLK